MILYKDVKKMRQRRSINVDYLNDEEIKNAEAKLLNKTDDHDNNNKISNNKDTSIFGQKGTVCYWIALTMFNLAMILFALLAAILYRKVVRSFKR